MAKFEVTVARVGEGEHEDAEFTVEADTISVGEDGRLVISAEGRGQNIAASSWGAFKVVRVASAGRRV